MTARFSRPATKVISSFVIACLVLLQIAGFSPSARAGASDDLKQIQYKYYFRGKYVQAIEALRTFLDRTDLRTDDVVAAREFLAASYILSGATDLGRDQFLKILGKDEQYAGPDPTKFKPEVVDAYNSAREEIASLRLRTPPEGDPVAAIPPETPEEKSSKPIYKKWWFYAGLAAAVVVLGAATSKKEEEKEDRPAPATGTVSIGVQVR